MANFSHSNLCSDADLFKERRRMIESWRPIGRSEIMLFMII